MKFRVLLTAASALLFLLGGCKKDEFVELVGVCPTVVSTSPTNGETAVPLVKIITVNFNEKMNPTTITQSSLKLQNGAAVAGTVSYSGLTASFTPAAPLIANMTYTGTVTTAVVDLTGNALQKDYVWSFSTGATVAPMVISTDPTNLETGVVLNKVVTATFNMDMDPLTLSAATYTVRLGATAIGGTITYLDSMVSFTPSAPLLQDTTYTATITTGAKNTAGVSLSNNYVWTFRSGSLLAPTVILTDPANNETGVALNKVVTATFSEAMNPSTITSTSFLLRQGATPITGTVSYSGTTASFTPTANLSSGLVYTATITTVATNLAGTSLANDYVWTFTTLSLPAPLVISTDPADGATAVFVDKVVRATFNMTMNGATLNALTFTLRRGATPVPGVVAYSASTASFTPNSDLLANTVYTATITTGAQSMTGVGLASDYVWTFTTVLPPTVVSTNPANLATNVPLNQVITATFSEAMNAASINGSTMTVRIGVTPVAGAISYTGLTATFIPTNLLLSDATYTATVTTGATSLAGVPLGSNYVWTFSTVPHLGPPPVDLNTADRFGIIAGVGISNNAGFSEIHDMDVGISPGVRSSVTGFPPAVVINGAIYCSDDLAPPGTAAMLIQAKQDLTDAYLFAEGATTPAPATVSGDIGGTTLAPGIYKSTSTLLIQSGDLTLDAQGDVNATWIFQVASGFTTVGGAGGNVILSGGAQAKNVFWQTGSSATVGDFTSFKGNIMALTSITMNSGATAEGRMLARNGAVVMTSTNIINKP